MLKSPYGSRTACHRRKNGAVGSIRSLTADISALPTHKTQWLYVITADTSGGPSDMTLVPPTARL